MVSTFRQHLDCMSSGEQSTLVLKTFKGFILYNTHAHAGLLSCDPVEQTRQETEKVRTLKMLSYSRQCLLGIKLHPKLTQHKKSGPDIVGWPCQMLQTFDPTNVRWMLGEMSKQ